MRRWPFGAFVLSIVFALVGSVPACADEPGVDRIYIHYGGYLHRADVGDPSITEIAPLDLRVVDLAFHPDGRLFALVRDGSVYEIDTETAAATELRPPSADTAAGENFFGSLTVGADGFLYLLNRDEQRMLRFDLGTGAETKVGFHPGPDEDPRLELRSLTTHEGLLTGFGGYEDGLLDFFFLLQVGEATGSVSRPSSQPDWHGFAFEYDSDGHVWVNDLSPIIFPASELRALDPETGETVGKPGYLLFSVGFPFAVRKAETRGCRESETRACFLDGRFRVEVEWRDGLGGSGSGHLLPGASPNAGLFWFFSEDNWELSIKMLDGCALSGHFWFFLAGTTDVGLTVKVTDTLTNEERSYENPVGRPLEPVLDLTAFAGCS